MQDLEKKMKGQFFTQTNPFFHKLFFQWLELIENFGSEVLLEPFCGTNNITIMMEEFGFYNQWACYDLDKSVVEDNQNKRNKIIIQNTLEKFPSGYNVAITNPPYLAKNSATRSGIDFPDTNHDDLYKLSLEKMLNNCNFVAAIIPESFLTQGLFHNRLYGVVSLTCKMFDDTDCPVCLALFVPESDDFVIYSGEYEVGMYSHIKKYLLQPLNTYGMKFNDPLGEIGINAVDSTSNSSIHFVSGDKIPSHKVKSSSRAITRISLSVQGIDTKTLIEECNVILADYRRDTSDLFMTSFKGLRKDGKYRRRLDFKTVRQIINIAIDNIKDRTNA
ncbi:TPA: hypothetical protein ACN35C_004724 [Vibrio parahaemolyticus]